MSKLFQLKVNFGFSVSISYLAATLLLVMIYFYTSSLKKKRKLERQSS